MSSLDGDVPCADCGTMENIIWHTDNVFWNAVCVDDSPILCIPCFVKRAESVGYTPRGWRVLPDWDWTGPVSAEHEQNQIARAERWMRGEV